MFKNPNYVYGSPDILVPAKLNLGEFMLDKFNLYKDKVFMINGLTDETITYGDILQNSMNLAVSLTQLGVRKGQAIGICSENRKEFFSVVFGIICTGATVTTYNVGYSKGELKHVLNITKPKIIFCSPLQYKNHEKTWRSTDFIKTIIVFGDERLNSSNIILYNDLVIPNRGNNKLKSNVKYEEFEVVDVAGQSDVCFVLYSSGTTGLPKGVMLTHLNVITSSCLPASHDPDAIAITVTPWFHVMGLVGNICAMATGRTAVYLPKFDLDAFLRNIEKYKVVQMTVVPPILVALTKVPIKYDISSVKLIYSGAAPLHKDTMDALTKKFPNIKVMQGYGMTEVTLAVTRDSIQTQHLAKPGGVGFVVAGSVLKVVDLETRKPLGPNQRGEICIKGNLVMKGYLGVHSKNDFDDEGFFRTGDIGYYDEDKYFFIVDRLKELIKYKGFQVPPAEIEALLLQHPSIKDAGVVGIDHASSGEVPVAFIVVQPRAELTEGEVKAFVAENLSNPKHLRGGVRFVNEIPKNLSGKILRKELKKMAKTGKSKL